MEHSVPDNPVVIQGDHSSIGFRPSNSIPRVAIRNEAGAKVGYLASVGGKTTFQDAAGHTVATILRFKQTVGRVGAQGGSFVPQDSE